MHIFEENVNLSEKSNVAEEQLPTATTSLRAMVSTLVKPWKPGVFHHVLGIYGGGLDH